MNNQSTKNDQIEAIIHPEEFALAEGENERISNDDSHASSSSSVEYFSDSDDSDSTSEENILLTKTVLWDETEDAVSKNNSDSTNNVDLRFGYVYIIHLHLKYDPWFRDRAFEVSVKVTCEQRFEIVGEKNVDRLIYSYLSQSDVVGYGSAILFVRPHEEFYDLATGLHTTEGPAYTAARILFDSHGKAMRILNEQLVKQEDTDLGGFLSIFNISIHPLHRGKDLGLRMMHEMLGFLKDPPLLEDFLIQQNPRRQQHSLARWTLAAVVPCPQGRYSNRCWKSWRLKYHIPEDKVDAGEGDIQSLAIYFARLGFVQAGRNRMDARVWILSRGMYFGEANLWSSRTGHGLWADKKGTAKSVNVFEVPSELQDERLQYIFGRVEYLIQKHKAYQAQIASELERVNLKQSQGKVFPHASVDIHTVNSNTISTNIMKAAELQQLRKNVPKKCRKMIQRIFRDAFPSSDAIDKSLAIHFFAFHVSDDDTTILETLIELGGNINCLDRNNQTPLHAAVQGLRYPAIKKLLSAGANPELRDSQDMTPLDLLLHNRKQLHKFWKASGRDGLLNKAEDVIPFVDLAKALYEHRRRQDSDQRSFPINGWFTPRMAQLLQITAQQEYLRIATRLIMLKWGFVENNECQLVKEQANHNIPFNTANNMSGSDSSLALSNGFKLNWSTIFQLLHRKRPPTVHNINGFISEAYFWDFDLKISKQMDTLVAFENSGGRIEHVVDALLGISESNWNNFEKDGDFVLMTHAQKDKLSACPKSPLDGLFDIARVMCTV